ncbi:MAG: tetratricopeptide repeat protein [Chloroflexi bacterium]|nr:tetratricopeptide repeat protein [Chloroflexota bacterium]
MNEAKCDICNAAINEPEGYLLTTTQVVRSPRFWLDYYRRHQAKLAAMDIPSYDAFLNSSECTTMTERIAQDATPWLVCKQCVHLFEVDQQQAWVYVRHWWESGRTFTPPGIGPAPLSEVKLEEEPMVVEEEAIPTPVTEKREQRKVRPPRGVPRWPPVVALLNLTGLGLGYLYIKRWLRWLVHFLLTVGLIATSFLTKGATLVALWAIIIGLWLLWMAFDGWRQSRRLVRATPPGTIGRAWLPLALSAIIVVLMMGGLGGYAALGRREFSAGMAAYEETDCRTAMRHFNSVTTFYALTLSPNVAAADARVAECSLLVFGENTRQQEEYTDAIASYEAYLHLYPESALFPFAQDSLAETYGDWATQLRQAEDYQAAIEKYQVVASDYPETSAGAQAPTLTAETYAEWAAQLQEAGEYDEAIEKYEVILNEYPDTPAGEEATTLVAAAYAEWAVNLRETGDYEEAVEKYEIILDEYPDAQAATGLEETVAQIYAEWATQLRERAVYSAAIAKYRAILSQYPNTAPAGAAQVEIGQTYNEWGRQLTSQREYAEAIDRFAQAKEATDDPGVIAAAEEGYAEALWGLSQDTTGKGRAVMEQALLEVCDGDPATSPAIGLAEEEPGRALVCGSVDFSLPADLKAAKPGHFRYAVSVDQSSTTVQRCNYTSLGCIGWTCQTVGTVVRKRHLWSVSVRDTLTARVVGERSFYGSQPDACPSTATFFFTGQETSKFGSSPSTDEIISWLRGIVR